MDLSNIVGLTGIPAFLYYSFMIVIAVFFAGWFLNSKLRHICEDNQKELENTVQEMLKRVDTLERDTLKVSTYQEGMSNVCKLIQEVKHDMKDNFNSLSRRIDELLLSKQAGV